MRTQIMNLCQRWADRAKSAWLQLMEDPHPSNTPRTDAASGDAPPGPDRAQDVVREAPAAPGAPGLNGSPP